MPLIANAILSSLDLVHANLSETGGKFSNRYSDNETGQVNKWKKFGIFELCRKERLPIPPG